MRSKDTKRTFFKYLSYECSALEEYLENMAGKGWLLESTKRGFFKFRKIETRKIKYSVDILNKVSIFDHKDSDVSLEYRQYCDAAGWTYICEDGMVQIFYTEGDKDITSIHTDEEEKFKVVFKDSSKFVYGQMYLIIFLIFTMFLRLSNDTEFLLATNMGIFMLTLVISVIFTNCIGIINFYIWVIKAKGRLKENKLMHYNRYKHLRIKNTLIIAYYLILILIFLVIFVIDIPGNSKLYITMALIMIFPMLSAILSGSCIKRFTYRKNYSKDANMGLYVTGILASLLISIILSYVIIGSIPDERQSEVPNEKARLTFTDFGYEKNDDENLNIQFNKSILAQNTFYSCNNGDSWFSYTIFESQYAWLVKLDENRLMSRLNYNIPHTFNLKLGNTNLPNNIRVYSHAQGQNRFVLVSEDKVIYFIGPNDISEEEFLNMAYKELF
ncbi:MAG: DUF2812 domain-containing protein [Clostridiaceae bacterium]|nr:DUF2812 domain-containing protein [Clostridiaceae bacterium]